MNQIYIVAKKEFGDALRNRVFMVFLAFLVLLTGISLYVGAVDFQAKVSIFNNAYQALVAGGQSVSSLTRPEFFPLQLLRASIEYFEIIGAILAIALGYMSIAKEKGNNTLPLIFTRPITKRRYILGKILGNMLLLALVCAILFLGILSILVFVGGVQILAIEVWKLFISAGAAFVYFLIFFLCALVSTIVMKSPSNALILAFAIWLFIVLLVPQIGDTMDTDNQVPGGFFNALHIGQVDSHIILKQFPVYETLRNGAEETSIAKHYERLTFALLGIKDVYNGKSLAYILRDKMWEVVWLGLFLIVLFCSAVLAFTRSEVLWQKIE